MSTPGPGRGKKKDPAAGGWLSGGPRMLPGAEAAFEAVLAIGLALLIGHYLDRWFGTDPWCFFALLVLGLGAAFRRLLAIAKHVSEQPPPEDRS